MKDNAVAWIIGGVAALLFLIMCGAGAAILAVVGYGFAAVDEEASPDPVFEPQPIPQQPNLQEPLPPPTPPSAGAVDLSPPPPLSINPQPTADRQTRNITARVTLVQGPAGVTVGQNCVFPITVVTRQVGVGYWCRAAMSCGTTRLYGVDYPRPNGFFNCELFAAPLGVAGEDRGASASDTDPIFWIDSRQSRVVVADDAAGQFGSPFRVEASIISVN